MTNLLDEMFKDDIDEEDWPDSIESYKMLKFNTFQFLHQERFFFSLCFWYSVDLLCVAHVTKCTVLALHYIFFIAFVLTYKSDIYFTHLFD